MSWRSGQRYSNDLRQRVLAAVDRGLPVYEAAPALQVSVSYIYKALARRRESGRETTLPAGGRPGRKLDAHLDALAARVKAHPDATLVELVAWARADLRVRVCAATMWLTLEALGFTLKKRRATRANKSAKMSSRRAWPGAKAKAA